MTNEDKSDIRHGEVTAHFDLGADKPSQFRITDKRGKGDPSKAKPLEPSPRSKVEEQPIREAMQVERVQSHTVARMSNYLEKWVQRAFESAALGERIGWEMSMIAATNPQGEQQPMWLIYAEIDGVQVGQTLPGAIMAPINATYEQFQAGAAQLVESLKKERTRLLSQGNGHGPALHPDLLNRRPR